jgi:hypothetical protein
MDGRSCTYDPRILFAILRSVDSNQILALNAPLRTPEMCARMARYMIERGADLNEPDGDGT